MSKTTLPALNFQRPKGVNFSVPAPLMERWDTSIRAEGDHGENTISIFDVIGYDYWSDSGATAKRIAAALRQIGNNNPVTVLINSPGGDMFEGVAIYNLLREHKGEVTVKIMGLAASAASVIAMAGDQILIARPSFFMIHNARICVCGDRNQLADYSDWLKPFDAAMADLYAARTGQDISQVSQWMDKEKWIGGSEAVDLGFAEGLLDSDPVSEGGDPAALAAIRTIESAMRSAGIPRTRARALMKELKLGKPGAADDTHTPGAVDLSLGNLSPLPKITFPA